MNPLEVHNCPSILAAPKSPETARVEGVPEFKHRAAAEACVSKQGRSKVKAPIGDWRNKNKSFSSESQNHKDSPPNDGQRGLCEALSCVLSSRGRVSLIRPKVFDENITMNI